MSTIKLVLEPDPDGTLHLPLPPELRHGKFMVTAMLEQIAPHLSTGHNGRLKGFGCLKGKISIAPDFDEPLEDFKEYME